MHRSQRHRPADEPGPVDRDGAAGPYQGESHQGRPAGSHRGGSHRGGRLRFALLVVLLIGAAVAMTRMNISPHHLGLQMRHSPVPAPLLAIGGSALLVCLLVPRTVLAFAAGTVFGTSAATLYTVIGVTLGATLSFGLGRLLGQGFVQQRLRGRAEAITQSVTGRGPWGVAVARMLPIAHFGLSNYAFGAAAARLPSYLLGTVLGIVPASAAYAALGAAVGKGDLAGAALLGCLTTALSVAGFAASAFLLRRRPQQRGPEPGILAASADRKDLAGVAG